MIRGQKIYDKPLYYFKVDEKTGKITRYEITAYEEGNMVSGKRFYRWKGISCIMYAYSNDLDRYKDWHIYTFNPDYDNVYEIIIEALQEKLKAAEKTYKRFKRVVEKVSLNAVGEENDKETSNKLFKK